MDETRSDSTEPPDDWPYASLLLFGFFGNDSPEGRRLGRTTALAMVVFVGAYWGILMSSGGWRLLPALGVPASAGILTWAYVRYLRELDELRQLIQLEALALSYGVVMVLAFAWVSVGFVRETFSPEPWLLLLWLLLAEPIRGFVLVYLARRYR